jgi:hypothetical protein
MRYLFALLLYAQAVIGICAPVTLPSAQPLAASQPASPPRFKQNDSPNPWQLSLPYVVLASCLLAGGLWWQKRRKGTLLNQEKALLQVIKSQRLSNKTILHRVRYHHYELLIAEHAQGITVLKRLPLPLESHPNV